MSQNSSTNSLKKIQKKLMHPPKPPLVLHVGVTGHRPDANKRPDPNLRAIREAIHEILLIIKNKTNEISSNKEYKTLFESSENDNKIEIPTKLRIVSSLAVGADSWVADQACNLGYDLHCPLPFYENEYLNDFITSGAIEEFIALKNKAKSVFQIDGTRDKNYGGSPSSYEASGRVIIQQSDLLIAIWDGNEAKGKGGTGQIVAEALQGGVPVIWINWHSNSGEWKLLNQANWRKIDKIKENKEEIKRENNEGEKKENYEMKILLEGTISDILLPPDLFVNNKFRELSSLRSDYYLESQRLWSIIGGFWDFFKKLILWRGIKWIIRNQDYVNTTEAKWKKESSAMQNIAGSSTIKNINDQYLHHYAWSNQLSIYYAGRYRSSFLLTYLLGALAVTFALFGIPALIYHRFELLTIIGELIIITSILILNFIGHRHRWHERWIEYRALAERLRISKFMVLFGGWRQQLAMPGHLAGYGNPINSWVYWHYRAVERSMGLPTAKLNHGYLKTMQFAFKQVLAESQIKYHAGNQRELNIINHRLHRFGVSLFIATLIACGVHLILELSLENIPSDLSIILIILNALLPAFGAAFSAIRNQGEFHRVAQRSEAMEKELFSLKEKLSSIDKHKGDPDEKDSEMNEEKEIDKLAEEGKLHSQDLRAVSENIARLMLNETLDWRIVFQDRPLVLPA